jgi:Flp pilus assembly CpaF family ATPase
MNCAYDSAMTVLHANLTPVADHLADPDVLEVMVNRHDNVWIERAGSMQRLDVELGGLAVSNALKALASIGNKEVRAIIDTRVQSGRNGLRIAAARYPVAIHGDMLCIRKHVHSARPLHRYLDEGAFAVTDRVLLAANREHVERPADEAVAQGGEGLYDFLRWMVLARENCIISGGTSSGKTTFMNALLGEIEPSRRLVTIEDTAELQIQVPNHVALEANEDLGVATRDLVRLAMRCRPDSVILGEGRDGRTAFDILDAANTGHSGCAVTLHADSAELALARFENLIRMAPEAANWPLPALRGQIATTFRFVIHTSRRFGSRGPDEVIEVLDAEGGAYQTRVLFSRLRRQ